MATSKRWQDMKEVKGVENDTPIRHEIHMDASVANFWYDKFGQFKTANPKDFGQLTYAQYLGEQVLTNLMRLMQGKVPK